MTQISTNRHPQLLSQKRQNQKTSDRVWGLIMNLSQMFFRSKTRKQLHHLDDHLLDDIGITRKQLEEEIAKPFWHKD